MKFMPIETAPLDGTDILVYYVYATVPIVHIAWYRGKKEWEEVGQFVGGFDSLEEWEGWWTYSRNSTTQEKLNLFRSPTHWMPVPLVGGDK